MLGLALIRLPYGYFVLLRWVVASAMIFVAIIAYGSRQFWGAWLYGLVAIVFNPIVPLRLRREVWRPLDLVGALLMLLAVFLIVRPGKLNGLTEQLPVSAKGQSDDSTAVRQQATEET
jgi:hypothetical protein